MDSLKFKWITTLQHKLEASEFHEMADHIKLIQEKFGYEHRFDIYALVEQITDQSFATDLREKRISFQKSKDICKKSQLDMWILFGVDSKLRSIWAFINILYIGYRLDHTESPEQRDRLRSIIAETINEAAAATEPRVEDYGNEAPTQMIPPSPTSA